MQHLVIGAGFAGLCAAIKLQEDGETRLPRRREGPRRRRHLARQHLPRRGLRRPEPALLLLLRAQPRLDDRPSPRSRRSRPTSRRSRRGPASSTGSSSTPPSSRPTWDEDAQRWVVETATTDGDGARSPSTTLVVGAGGLSEPRLPDIDGIDDFQGEVFHSARWNHDVDLTGKRVAVIGTGASAIQIVPELQKVVGHLDVYQRTAPYVIPRNDRTLHPGRAVRCSSASRRCSRLYRTGIYWGTRDATCPASPCSRSWRCPPRSWRWPTSARASRTPSCASGSRPTFEIGCKRILISNDYYPALAADNVDLVTDPIAKVTGNAVVTADGVERPIDVLVVATGFYTTELPIAEQDPRPRRRQPGRHLARRRDGGVQGHDRPRLPQPVHDRRPEHRPRPLEHGVHHRVAGRLHPRRDPRPCGSNEYAAVEPTAAGAAGVERRACSAG